MFNLFRRKSPAQLRLERINAFIDGELTPAESAAFEREMAMDAGLQAEVDAVRELDALLNKLPQVDVPHDFTLSAPPLTSQPRYQQFAPALAGFAMLVLLCGVIFSLLQNGFFGASPESAEPQIVRETVVVEVIVEGETVVEEVVVTQIVESEVIVEEVVVTLVLEPTPQPAAEENDEMMEDAELSDDSELGLLEFPMTRNLWLDYSTVNDDFQNELANRDNVPRLHRGQEPLLLDFQSDIVEVDGQSAIIVDILPAFWEDGEWVDSADLAFTYQTCRDLQLYATDAANNGWATVCPPLLLQDVVSLSRFRAQFILSGPMTDEQFRSEIGQAPIMAEHIWGTIVLEALAFDDVAQGRDFLLSATP